MARIGRELEEVEVMPLPEREVPTREPERELEPVKEPVEEPEKVAA